MKIFIIILVNLFSWYKSLNYGYVGDDATAHALSGKSPTPFLKMVLYDAFAIGRWIPEVSHSLSLVTHTIVCCLIYLVFGRDDVSFMASLLFSINPINSQCAVWASGRFYAYNAILCLTMQITPFFLVLYTLTGILSVNALCYPLVYLKSNLWPLALISPIGIWAFRSFVFTKTISEGANMPEARRKFKPRKFILYFKTFLYYTSLCIVPNHIGFSHPLGAGSELTEKYNEETYEVDWTFWMGLFIWIEIVLNLIFNYSPVLFGILWFLVLITPFCNILMLGLHIAERYVYLANVGLMLFLANCISAIPYPYNLITFYGIMIAYFVRLQSVLPMYKSEYRFREYAMIEFPDYWKPYFDDAMVEYDSKNYEKAIEMLLEAKIKCDHDFKINFNLASLCCRKGLIGDAEYFLSIAKDNIYQTKNFNLQKKNIDELFNKINEAKKTKTVDTMGLVVFK